MIQLDYMHIFPNPNWLLFFPLRKSTSARPRTTQGFEYFITALFSFYFDPSKTIVTTPHLLPFLALNDHPQSFTLNGITCIYVHANIIVLVCLNIYTDVHVLLIKYHWHVWRQRITEMFLYRWYAPGRMTPVQSLSWSLKVNKVHDFLFSELMNQLIIVSEWIFLGWMDTARQGNGGMRDFTWSLR